MTSSIDTARQYVRSFDYGDGPGLAVCTALDMAASIEAAHYSGDNEGADDRLFTIVDGAMTEVEIRGVRGSSYADEDDYLYSKHGVYVKGADAEPIETFTVRIDGRA